MTGVYSMFTQIMDGVLLAMTQGLPVDLVERRLAGLRGFYIATIVHGTDSAEIETEFDEVVTLVTAYTQPKN